MMNENAEDFWSRVKTFIKQNKLTQEIVCNKCNVTLNVMKSWIHNNRLPDAMQSVRIAKVLNTSVEYLVSGEERNIYKEKYDRLVNAIKDLPVD